MHLISMLEQLTPQQEAIGMPNLLARPTGWRLHSVTQRRQTLAIKVHQPRCQTLKAGPKMCLPCHLLAITRQLLMTVMAFTKCRATVMDVDVAGLKGSIVEATVAVVGSEAIVARVEAAVVEVIEAIAVETASVADVDEAVGSGSAGVGVVIQPNRSAMVTPHCSYQKLFCASERRACATIVP